MRCHILYNFKDEPWGGGNQFLVALRQEWQRMGIYAEQPEQADVILFNSYPFGAERLFDEAFALKRRFPDKVIVYRLNGPISWIRGTDTEVDQMIAAFNRALCDGIIYQSHWCEEQNRQAFDISSRYQTVIHNAPDLAIFYPPAQAEACGYPSHAPTKLIATSWSSNPRKGFDVYRYLDERLDFKRYKMTFVGNSPVRFRNITMIEPLASAQLANVLRQHDIFITASQSDPCSNALIEALACGLPAVALRDGGHPELVQQGGELFDGVGDVLQAIDRVAARLEEYRQRLPHKNIHDVANMYIAFCKKIYDDAQRGRLRLKRAKRADQLKLKAMILSWQFKRVWNKLVGSKT